MLGLTRSDGMRLAIEFAVVVLSVLLALGLDGWREDRARRAFVTASLEAIEQELADNEVIIQESLAYHETIAPAAGAALRAVEAGEADPEFGWYQGIQSPWTRAAAYQTALASGVFADIDPGLSAEIGDAYSAFSSIQRQSDIIDAAILDIARKPDERFLRILWQGGYDLFFNETQALTETAEARVAVAEALGRPASK